MRFMTVALVAAAASAAWMAARRRSGYGSNTNASDAIDDIELRPRHSAEELVDASVMESFPASDPPAFDEAGETAYERREHGKAGSATAGQVSTPQSARRSPDWMTRPPR